MKTFSLSPLVIAAALIATISGCAATGAGSQGDARAPMMGKDACSCCAMQKDGMSQGQSDKPMGMMQGKNGSAQGGMCSPGKQGGDKGGCACCGDMGMMGGSGCGGMDKQEMSPEMHKRHMDMMRQHHPETAPGKAVPPPVTK